MSDTFIYIAIALGQIAVSIIPIVIAVQSSKYKRNQKGQFEKKAISGLKMAQALLVITITAAIFVAYENVKFSRDVDEANRKTVDGLMETAKRTNEVQKTTDTSLRNAKQALAELAIIDAQEDALRGRSIATLKEQRVFKKLTSGQLKETSYQLKQARERTEELMRQSDLIAENTHKSLLTQQKQIHSNDKLLHAVTDGVSKVAVEVDASSKKLLAATSKSDENTRAVAYATESRKLPKIKVDAPITIVMGAAFLRGRVEVLGENIYGPFTYNVSKGNELLISGELRDASGSYAVHVTNSEIKTEIGLHFDINSDEDALEIVNRFGKPIVQILVSNDRHTLFINYARLDVSSQPAIMEIARPNGNTREVYSGGEIDLRTPCIFAYPGVDMPGKRLRTNEEILTELNKAVQ